MKALEVTLAADPVLALPTHAGTVQLARSVAAELDEKGGLPTRTLAAYVSLLSTLRRISKDAAAASTRKVGTSSHVASIKASIRKGATE
ncbi:hypothetical protein [Curtobacterium sp. MCJR17_020]|uniref:hypothetical protein n=1 Tax=Curtobacterium sp. MCJR17_020 TaxID=2175619 RepID=UPI0011B78B3E|nr:hypothetical protein [Curtobacterium sp. MCJR17_020]WIE70801.1 hypothetical protein DEJ14_011340 [Curtobacterium sp. MCJR17_020]